MQQKSHQQRIHKSTSERIAVIKEEINKERCKCGVKKLTTPDTIDYLVHFYELYIQGE